LNLAKCLSLHQTQLSRKTMPILPPKSADAADARPKTALNKAAEGTVHRAYVGLGANLGDALATLRQAIQDLQAHHKVLSLRASSFYASAPVEADGPDFVNAVVELDTTLSPYELLAALQRLEHSAGRERPYPNAPRTLDLDVLLYDDLHMADAKLTIPHPRMWQRAFVLWPLQELAPDRVSPDHLAAVAPQRVEKIRR